MQVRRVGRVALRLAGRVPNSRRHKAGESVVPNIWSSAHRLAWLTMARNRPVCPAIQLAM